METAILASVFVAALAVSGFATLAFSVSVDEVLKRLLPAELAAAWSRYVKFALFTASFIGGLRLQELGALVSRGQGDGARLAADQGLVEVYRTIAGSLGAAAWTLLAFFAGTLCVYGAARVYEGLKPSAAARPGDRRPQERHSSLPI